MFIAANPPMGAVISCWVREHTDDELKVSVSSTKPDGSKGHVVRELKAPSRRGINRIVWDLQPPPRQRLANPDDLPDFVPAGTYKVTVSLGDEKRTTTVEVLPVPGASKPADRVVD